MKRARPKSKKAELKKEKKLKNKETEIIVSEEEKQKKPKKKKKDKKKKTVGGVLFTIFKVFLSIIAVLVILLFIIMGFGLFNEGDLLAPIEDGKVNVLLLGVDEEGLRSDTIMVASYDVNEAEVNLLSIPRDTRVYIENRSNARRKVNEIHALSSKQKKGEIAGAEATAEVVTQLTGIPINYYVEFSFSSVDSLFEILGPVEFDVPDIEGRGRGMNYDDPVQNLHIHLKPGVQMLSGNQIQQFLRYRKSNYGVGTGSDEDRMTRQQDLFKAVVDQKVNAGILIKVPSIFSQISKEIRTNVEIGDITKYVRYMAKLSGESINAYTLPGESDGTYYIINKEKTAALIKDAFGIECTPTESVKISDEHSQKVLKGGNKNSKNKGNSSQVKPTQTVTPVKTHAPSGKPANTPAPTVKPHNTNVPLEDVDDGVIDLD